MSAFTTISSLVLYTARSASHCHVNYVRDAIIIISNLSNDRSKASSKTIPPHSAI